MKVAIEAVKTVEDEYEKTLGHAAILEIKERSSTTEKLFVHSDDNQSYC